MLYKAFAGAFGKGGARRGMRKFAGEVLQWAVVGSKQNLTQAVKSEN